MNANQAAFPVRKMCRVLGVSHSGFYDWLQRPPSQRAMEDVVLVECIRTIHAESDATYGMPRIRAELAEQGVRVGGKRIARLMRRAELRGVSKRRGYTVTTQRDDKQRPAPDLVKREFKATGPNQLWVADMTYVPTWAGFIYLAVVIDVWSGEWLDGRSACASLSGILCARHRMTRRSMYAKQEDDEGGRGRGGEVAEHPEGTH